MHTTTSEIWVYGTFDVDNFGDLLLPYILNHKLSQYSRIVPVSPEGNRTQFRNSLPASPISLGGKPNLILIGGGNIVTRQICQLAEHPSWRFDTDIAALSIWLGPIFQALRLRVPLIWNIPGCLPPLDFTGTLKDSLNRLIRESSTFPVRLRDQSSAQLFAQFYDGPIEVYPDTAFSITDVYSKTQLEERVERFKSLQGIEGPHMVCHIKHSYVDTSYEHIASVLSQIALDRSLTLVLLPLGLCHGDLKALLHVSSLLSCPFFLLQRDFCLDDTLSLLGTASLTITSSYHAAIVSASYGTPLVVVAPHTLTKFDDLHNSLGFIRLTSWSDLKSDVTTSDPQLLAKRSSDYARTLSHHWRDITSICSTKDSSREPLRPLPSHYPEQQPIARTTILNSLLRKPTYTPQRAKCPICSSHSFSHGGSLHYRRRRVCSGCGSRPRHRAVYSALKKLNLDFSSAEALMFSRDPSVDPSWFSEFEYSIFGKTNHLDLQAIERPSDSYDFIFLNHVLEHVEDHRTALSELERILRFDGIIFITVPSPTVFHHTNDWGFADPSLHHHYRTYGRDFYGFLVSTLTSLSIYEVETCDPITQAWDYLYLCHKTNSRKLKSLSPLSLCLPEPVPQSTLPVLEDGLWHVRRLLETRCLARAKRALAKLSISFPLELRVQMLEADLYHLSSDFESENQLLAKCRQQSPHNKAIILRQARLLSKTGSHHEALSLLIANKIASISETQSLDDYLRSVLYPD